jgi:hypothetical protein
VDIESRSIRSRAFGVLTARPPLKSRLIRASVLILMALIGQRLWLSTAAADGTIFALVTLTNIGGTTILIPAGSASTGQLFGLPSGAAVFGAPAPGGLPAPAALGPGATIVFGTMSNGGFLATTGTGGQLDIPSAAQTIHWSAPWGYFNGNIAFCSSSITPDSPPSGSTFVTPPVNVVAGPGYVSAGYGPNTCVFAFTVK